MSDIREGLTLLKRREFAQLFVAYLISYTGTAMAPIAMAFGVLELTGSTKASSIVIAAPIAAQIVMLLLGGVLADRTSRQKMLVLADLMSMAMQLTIAYLFLSGQATVPTLLGLMLVNGIAFALGTPAAMGFIPQIVDRADLQSANALLGVARNSAMMMGAALAGILVATVGPGWTLALDGLSFGVSALLIVTLRPKAQAATDEATLFEDLRLGWQAFIGQKWLWTIVLQFSLIVAAIEAVFGLIGPAVAKSQLGGAVAWGMISAGFGLGTLIGGLVGIRLNPKRPMLFATYCTLSFCLVPLGLSVPLAVGVLALLAVIQGIAGQMFAVLWYTTLQKMIAANMLSRVSAYDHLGSIALAPLGIVIGGYLYESIGSQDTLLIAAATVLLPTFLIFMVRDVRELTSQQVEQRAALHG
ncbi:MAG: MFS transporter [Pseudomonadales bacterium]